jgi:hypothetical protein
MAVVGCAPRSGAFLLYTALRRCMDLKLKPYGVHPPARLQPPLPCCCFGCLLSMPTSALQPRHATYIRYSVFLRRTSNEVRWSWLMASAYGQDEPVVGAGLASCTELASISLKILRAVLPAYTPTLYSPLHISRPRILAFSLLHGIHHRQSARANTTRALSVMCHVL